MFFDFASFPFLIPLRSVQLQKFLVEVCRIMLSGAISRPRRHKFMLLILLCVAFPIRGCLPFFYLLNSLAPANRLICLCDGAHFDQIVSRLQVL